MLRRPLPLAAMIRLSVYAMLVLSASTTWIYGDALWRGWREGNLSLWAPLAPLLTFAAFVGVYSVDRYLLVMRRGYSAGGALWQVGVALLFLTLLLPASGGDELQGPPGGRLEGGSPQAALLLLEHHDPRVRDAACALLAKTFTPDIYGRIEGMAHHDPDSAVRGSCARALQIMHTEALRQRAAPPPRD